MLGSPNFTKGVLVSQLSMVAMLVISTYSFGPLAGVSAFFGGLVSILPSWIFRRNFFKSSLAQKPDPTQILKAFYWGEGFKYISLVCLFALTLSSGLLKPLLFFFAFVLTEFVHWGYCFFSLRRAIAK
jgi:ATP synthase protein I